MNPEPLCIAQCVRGWRGAAGNQTRRGDRGDQASDREGGLQGRIKGRVGNPGAISTANLKG